MLTHFPLSEVITHGHVDKGGRGPDGTITVVRAGGNLAGTFGSIQGDVIIAFCTLARKAGWKAPS